MKSNHDNSTVERGSSCLAIPLALNMKKPLSKVWKTSMGWDHPGSVAAIYFQSLERNKKKTMATPPAFPYNPHK